MGSLPLSEHRIERAMLPETLELYYEQKVLEWGSLSLITIPGVLIIPHNYDIELLDL
jgi:hypothetical protein